MRDHEAVGEDPVIEAGGPVCDLGGGVAMPLLGLGVWQLAEGREAQQAVEWALEAGYRHIDTAAYYRNEQSVGRALRASGLPREDVFITTKWLPLSHAPLREVARSLERLGLDRVDLYLVHWPLPGRVVRSWREFEEIAERGLARAIGVSNFGRGRLARLLRRARRAPSVNQVQFSPFEYRARLLDYCRAEGVALEAYSPLARGRALDDPVIVAAARRLDRTPAQVMLRWALQHGAAVIPKSAHRERIRSNARIFDFELDAGDMAALDALDRSSHAGRARY